MDEKAIVEQLEKNIPVFKYLLEEVPDHIYHWKPAPDKWNLLEILCHLYDEEREDFRTRVRLTLENPEQALPTFNPLNWVTEREYSKQDYFHKLLAFLSERQNSVNWLRSLESPNWRNAYQHPKFGPMSARLFLNNWLAHDYMHIRQINKNKYLYLKEHVKTGLEYAGNW